MARHVEHDDLTRGRRRAGPSTARCLPACAGAGPRIHRPHDRHAGWRREQWIASEPWPLRAGRRAGSTWRRQVKAAELSLAGAVVSHRAAAVAPWHPGLPTRRASISAVATSGPSVSPFAVVHRRRSAPSTTIDGIVDHDHGAHGRRSRRPDRLSLRLAAVFDDLVVNRRLTVDALRQQVRAPGSDALSRHRRGAVHARRSHRRRQSPPRTSSSGRCAACSTIHACPTHTHQSAFPWWPRCALPGRRAPARLATHRRGRWSALAHPRGGLRA